MILEPGGPAYRAIKRAIDIMVAGLLLFLLAPAMGLIALLIRVDDPKAPILFRQRRCGLGGRSFELCKFRTMVRDADALKEELRARSVVAWPDFRVVDDPRVTPLGRVLRRTSLDELPQLLNVLRGDMSIVGPRPTSFAAARYELWHTSRLDVPPGITGLWQLEGRNVTSFDQRLRLDMQYIRRRSVPYDLALMVRTAGVVFRRSGA
jgi:lipopolysaccharide/colanic/teichoic acid biosynthesis glycosyltransferase